MPFKKFQDQEGLASISRALASRKPQVSKGENDGSARYEVEWDTTEDSSKKRRRKVEERAAEVDQPPSQIAHLPKQAPSLSLSKASAGGMKPQSDLSILEHRKNPKTMKKKRVDVKNSGGILEEAVAAELDEQQEDPRTSSELQPLAPHNVEHLSQSSQPNAKHKSFRDFYVQSFTSAFSTDLYDLQQVDGAPVRVDLLLRCIESGCDIFSCAEKQLFGVSL